MSEVNKLGSCIEGHKIKSYLNKTVLLSAYARMLHITTVVTTDCGKIKGKSYTQRQHSDLIHKCYTSSKKNKPTEWAGGGGGGGNVSPPNKKFFKNLFFLQ